MLSLTLGLGLLALAGCGSSSSSTSSSTSTPASTPATTSSAASSTPAPAAAGGQTLSLAANAEGNLKFDTTSLSAKAGKVTINFTNKASLEHNVTVASSSGAVVGATPTFQGGSKSVELTLTPGTYKFYCSVPGHRQAGMEGTLVVK
jgi:plastocyanin